MNEQGIRFNFNPITLFYSCKFSLVSQVARRIRLPQPIHPTRVLYMWGRAIANMHGHRVAWRDLKLK